MTVDLDTAAAARREEKGEGPIARFGGEEYQLAPELPYATLEALRGMAVAETAPAAIVDLTRALLGEHYDAFVATSPSVDDVNELVGGLMKEYGVSAPLPSSAS